jgi:hypothetical protein
MPLGGVCWGGVICYTYISIYIHIYPNTYLPIHPPPTPTTTPIQELFTPEADLEELRSWYIANRDWLGQGTRLVLAAKSLRVRRRWCLLGKYMYIYIYIYIYVCVYINK